MSLIQSLYTFITKTKISSAKLNQNFTTVKDAVNDNATQITTNATNITGLQGSVSSLSSDLSTVSGNLSTIFSTVSSLQTTVNGLPTKTYVDNTVAAASKFSAPKYSGGNTYSGAAGVSVTSPIDGYALFVTVAALNGESAWYINGFKITATYSWAGGWADSNACLFPVSKNDVLRNDYGSITIFPVK